MKKLFNRLKNLPVPRLLRNKYLLTGVLFLLWILLFDPINLIDWISEQHKLHTLRSEKKLLERNIDMTTRNIQAFSHPDSLEKMAREQFFFAGPDEEIFIIHD
jgi:cell division protein FtsB